MFKKGVFVLIFAFLGFIDAAYLTVEHYAQNIPPCAVHVVFVDCGKVLRSAYSLVWGFPLALIGVIHYTVLIVLLLLALSFRRKIALYLIVVQSTIGLLASAYFVYLQIVVIQAICLYCMVSALISLILFISINWFFRPERKRVLLFVIGIVYKNIVKRILFLIEPDVVHTAMVRFGEVVGSLPMIQRLTDFLINDSHPMLAQKIAGVEFAAPIGLSAGFDYEARLTQSLASWGFGFQTIGTITNSSYNGNPRPMLGRLPRSKSLMVNKGFKNLGAAVTIRTLYGKKFKVPVGVSIGRTNSRVMVDQQESVADIVKAFVLFEASTVEHSYYELNISCPNLFGPVSFYPPENLEELLVAVDNLKLQRPVFVKMPIDRTDADVVEMLQVIARHSPVGLIFGNLQKDRSQASFVPEEIERFTKGGFSGKPTFDRSNELISLTYQHYAKRFVIIGCGGVFSAADAYEKIIRGASLVQLITGMIFEGPQLISEINFGLVDLLERDGFSHISQAIGSKIR